MNEITREHSSLIKESQNTVKTGSVEILDTHLVLAVAKFNLLSYEYCLCSVLGI